VNWKISNLSYSLLLGFILAIPAISQQTDRDLYVSLYKQNEYEKAIIVLKRLTKQKASDGDAWYYLGLTYLKVEKEKDAARALEKAVALKPSEALFRTGLAYAYLLRNDQRAWNEASESLKLDAKNAEAHYILGVSNLRTASYNMAYERARKAIELNPKFTNAYLLKSQALVSSFSLQSGTVGRPKSARNEMLLEAVGDLETFIELSPQNKDANFYKTYLESLKFFAEYYNRPENQKTVSFDDPPVAGSNKTPVKIISKPRATYTDKARQANVSGTIRLLVGLSADGKVSHIMVLKGLGYGLDEQALAAARQIKFEPPKQDGKPVSTVVTFEYSFAIY
jgi:TonB family protein